MRTLFLIAFLLPLLAHSQKNWQLGFDINPSYYRYYNIADDTVTDRNVIVVQEADIAKMPRSWSVGGRAHYMFNRHLGFVTGIRYNWSRAEFKRDFFHNNEYGLLSIDNHYLQLPIGFAITSDQRKDEVFYFNIGLAPAWHINYRRVYEADLTYPSNNDRFTTKSVENNQYLQGFYQETRQGEVTRTEFKYEGTKYYNTFTLFAFAELGMQTKLNDVSTFFFGFNSFVTVIDPEKKENWTTHMTMVGGGAPRPRTTFIHIGIQAGWMFELDSRR